MQTSPQIIQSALQSLRAEQPALRMRDIAQRLGISEATLVASACGSHTGTIRLTPDPAAQFAALGTLGRVMALTRNSGAVIEKIGVYGPVEHGGHASQVLGPDIDLRIFFHRFHVGFAVTAQGPRGPQRSLQFFDARGDAVHKVHLQPDSDLAAFDQLVDRFASTDQSPHQPLVPTTASPSADTPKDPNLADADVDVTALRTAFSQMQDTHEFFALLRRFSLRRTQALRLLGPQAARPVDRLALHPLLHAAAESALPIMVFVGSPAVIQIHSGAIATVKQLGPWLNILDPGFNLHVDQGALAHAWVVQKPTADGPVSSLELYDAAGESVAYVFSKRKPGQTEADLWRTLLARLPDAQSPAAPAHEGAA